MMNLIAGTFTGVAMIMHGFFGGHSTTIPSLRPQMATTTASTTREHEQRNEGKGYVASSTAVKNPEGMKGILGQVTVVNGSTLTVFGKNSAIAATSTFTVDISSARIYKEKKGVATVQDIAVGDRVIVNGAVSGSSVIASVVLDSAEGSNHPLLQRLEGRDQSTPHS